MLACISLNLFCGRVCICLIDAYHYVYIVYMYTFNIAFYVYIYIYVYILLTNVYISYVYIPMLSTILQCSHSICVGNFFSENFTVPELLLLHYIN